MEDGQDQWMPGGWNNERTMNKGWTHVGRGCGGWIDGCKLDGGQIGDGSAGYSEPMLCKQEVCNILYTFRRFYSDSSLGR